MIYSNYTELSIPLVGTLPQEAQLEQNEVSTDFTDEEEQAKSCNETMLDLALYSLLYLQLGSLFYAELEAVNCLLWSNVSASICLFIVTSHLYRCALTAIGVSKLLAFVIPELIIVAAMSMLLLHQVIPAYFIILAGMLTMALTVVVVNTSRLWQYAGAEKVSPTKLVLSTNEQEVFIV